MNKRREKNEKESCTTNSISIEMEKIKAFYVFFTLSALKMEKKSNFFYKQLIMYKFLQENNV